MRFFIVFIFLLYSFVIEVGFANAPPEYFIVRGKIVNENLTPKNGTFDIRASLWMDADASVHDLVNLEQALGGDIHKITLESDGRFEILVGSKNALPVPFSFDTYKYLQLDAKKTSDTVYNILDRIFKLFRISVLPILTFSSCHRLLSFNLEH